MSSNNSEKPSAPLISVRRSFRLRGRAIVVLITGMWLTVGVFGLFRHARALAGPHVGWAYAAAGLLMLPSLLSNVELRSWIGHAGGSYRLLRAMERNNVTFMGGWAYLLGWAAVSALLARAFALYAGELIQLAGFGSVAEVWLILGLLGISILANVAGSRFPWRITVGLAGTAILGLVVLVVALVVRAIQQSVPLFRTVIGSGSSFFGATLIIIASLWVLELTADTGDRRRRKVQTTLLLAIGGPLAGAILGLVGGWAAPGAASLELLTEAVLPGAGTVFMAAVGTLATGTAWQVLALLMLRRLQVIGLDGWLPAWLLRPYARVKTPILLILAQALLTPLALLGAQGLHLLPGSDASATAILGALAAIAYLIIQISINVEAILLDKHPRAVDRPFRLPLYPAIPATGIAINGLLIFAGPWPAVIAAVLWFALGALVYWRIGLERMRESQLGVTVFQDAHHGGVVSPYPVVVPVANPDTAMHLVSFGAEIARAHGGHVSVVQVVQVPEHLPLDSERFEARHRQELLERVLGQAAQYDVPIEGVTRLSRSIAQGILDTISEESAELVVMGWNAQELSDSRYTLGHLLDEVIETAPCDVVVVRGEWNATPERIVVPVAGGPHAPSAAELALDLTEATGGHVVLLHIVREDQGSENVEAGREMLETLRGELRAPERVEPCVVRAPSVVAGILETANGNDAILLGASEQSFLGDQVFGHVPLQIAQKSNVLFALVRGHTGITGLVARRAWTSITELLPSLTPEEQIDTYHRMRRAARPNVNFFVLTAASAIIATLGLLLNSPAVIIGAMLVAPLMSPFLSVAMGIVTGDVQTIRNGLTAILQGVLLAVFLSIIATRISPLAEATPEVLARTRPNLLDLMVALTSGVAGSYATARKEVGAALPGVAIAAALVPPLCSVGIGVALGSPTVALGALLLFITNLVAIVFASAIVFLLLGIRPPQRPERQRWLRQGLTISLVSLAIVSVPLGVVLFQAVRSGQIEQQAHEIVEEQLVEWGDADLVEFDVEEQRRHLVVEGTIYAREDISQGDIAALDAELERVLRRSVDVRLFTIEGYLFDSQQSTPPSTP